MKILLVGLALALGAVASVAESQLIPLVDPADPLLITKAKLEFEDDVRPVVTIELENDTGLSVSSNDVWLNITRFYTKAEVERAGDRKVWDCGQISRADLDSPQMIAPGGHAIVRMSLKGSCAHNREHEHFFLTVQYIGKGPLSASWKRDPKDLVRLLGAAQPHP